MATPFEILKGHVDRGVLPGAVWLVRRGSDIDVGAVGTIAFGSTTPMRRDTIFRITSMTKPITVAATMLLVQDGALRLDEPVDRLLPELANRRVLRSIESPLDDTLPAQRPITTRDLLTFTFGFGLVFPFGTYPIQKRETELELNQGGPPKPHLPPAPDEWMRRFGTLPLMFQPGERWVYNTGADVLAVLVARAARQPFPEFLGQRVFEPLGMVDTDFHVPSPKLDRFCVSYMVDFATGSATVWDEVRGDYARPPAFPSGGAGLVSTADDYDRFASMLLAGGVHGGKRILSEESVRLMTTDHLTPEQKAASRFFPGFFDTRGWGFGMEIITAPDDVSAVPGRYGWNGGLGTYWINDPAQRLTGILMTQRAFDGHTFFDREVWKAAYAK